MPVRIFGPILLLVLAALLWLLWPAAAEAPRPAAGAAPAPAAAPIPSSAPAPLAAPDESEGTAQTVRTELPTAATFAVEGRAVSAADTPLPGARIRVRTYAGSKAEGAPTIDELLTAGSDGHFVWNLTPPAALTCLELRGEGERVRSYPETFVLTAGDLPPPPFDLWIVPLDAVVHGRVLDPQDQPIAGAHVGNSTKDGVLTDADGRFELAVENRPSVRVAVDAHGFVQLRQEVPVDVAQKAGEVELHLRAANRIHGRVTDEQQRPVQGATVRTFYTLYGDGSLTDADGRFLLDTIDPSLERHSLFARKDGFVEARAEVAATGPDVEQDLVMLRGVEVRGDVRGPQGEPLAAATVFLGFSPSAYNRLDAITDAQGQFVFPCVGEGEETLNVERRGYSGQRQKVQVPKAPAVAVVVHVRLEAGHFIGGRAVGGDGKPIAGVSIAPRLDGEYLDGIRGKTDADGRFRLDGLPAQGLDLEFYGVGVLRKNEKVAAVDRDDLVVTLERHGRMAGTVVDGNSGQPIRDFRIRFGRARLAQGETSGGGYSASWVRGGRLFHDEAGVFRIDEGVKIGSVFALEASAAGYGPSTDDHVTAVLDPDPAQVVIRLYPGVSIEGVVQERGTGQPIEGARLKAWASGRPLQPHEPNDDEGRPIATSDARGAFHLDNLGPGVISIEVTHADWLPMTHGPITITPGTGVPAQVVELSKGVVVTVDARSVDGAPLVGAAVKLVQVGRGSDAATATTDELGSAQIARVSPGDYEVWLTPVGGPLQGQTLRRVLQVAHDDCRLAFVASDGDASLDVVLEADEPLPQGLQLFVMRRGGAATESSPFRARSATAQPGHTLIPLLPAMELSVTVMGPGNWMGGGQVTTLAGQTVPVRIQVKQFERNR